MPGRLGCWSMNHRHIARLSAKDDGLGTKDCGGSMMTSKSLPNLGIVATSTSLSLAAAAFVLGCFSLPRCDFASLPTSVVDSTGSRTFATTELGVGLWSHQTLSRGRGGVLVIENTCAGYGDGSVAVDGAWRASRAFGVLALLIGGADLAVLAWCACRRRRVDADCDAAAIAARTQSRIIGAIFVVSSFYQGLTLLFLRGTVCSGVGEGLLGQRLGEALSPAEVVHGDRCEPSEGANMCIASTACWFAAGVLLSGATMFVRGDSAGSRDLGNNSRNEGDEVGECDQEIDPPEDVEVASGLERREGGGVGTLDVVETELRNDPTEEAGDEAVSRVRGVCAASESDRSRTEPAQRTPTPISPVPAASVAKSSRSKQSSSTAASKTRRRRYRS